jgi:hypothetical protein
MQWSSLMLGRAPPQVSAINGGNHPGGARLGADGRDLGGVAAILHRTNLISGVNVFVSLPVNWRGCQPFSIFSAPKDLTTIQHNSLTLHLRERIDDSVPNSQPRDFLKDHNGAPKKSRSLGPVRGGPLGCIATRRASVRPSGGHA